MTADRMWTTSRACGRALADAAVWIMFWCHLGRLKLRILKLRLKDFKVPLIWTLYWLQKAELGNALIERLDTTGVVKWPVGFPLSFSHCRYVAPHPTKEGWCEPQMPVFTDTLPVWHSEDFWPIHEHWTRRLSHTGWATCYHTRTHEDVCIYLEWVHFIHMYTCMYVYAVYIYIHNMWMSRSNTKFRRYLILKDLQTDSCGGEQLAWPKSIGVCHSKILAPFDNLLPCKQPTTFIHFHPLSISEPPQDHRKVFQ